tara:strand:- start:1442 stop:1750 length:309 start_codon:yes stop_codon:yes gene_type:complete
MAVPENQNPKEQKNLNSGAAQIDGNPLCEILEWFPKQRGQLPLGSTKKTGKTWLRKKLLTLRSLIRPDHYKKSYMSSSIKIVLMSFHVTGDSAKLVRRLTIS